jgi:hypothetical protein
MEAGAYFSLYVVLVNESDRAGIYFLRRDLQTRDMYNNFVFELDVQNGHRRDCRVGTDVTPGVFSKRDAGTVDLTGTAPTA